MGLIAPISVPLDHFAAAYQSHSLHTDNRHWPQTNCYIDLWIEVLHAQGMDPVAALSFTVTQDYEGDHFTFSKYPVEDLELLYGLAVQELAVYDRLETHLHGQAQRGHMTLVEVDGFYLPDTRGLTYRQAHGKTTIGIRHIDVGAKRLAYFHNSGLYVLDGADYDGIFAPRDQPDYLFPYVELVKQRAPALVGDALLHASLQRLRVQLGRRPAGNPVRAWRAEFSDHLQALLQQSPEFFHQYAFNLNRQLGMNWELLGSYLRWLDLHGQTGLDSAVDACTDIADLAKILQFRMARLVGRKRHDPCTDLLTQIETRYDQIMEAIVPRLG